MEIAAQVFVQKSSMTSWVKLPSADVVTWKLVSSAESLNSLTSRSDIFIIIFSGNVHMTLPPFGISVSGVQPNVTSLLLLISSVNLAPETEVIVPGVNSFIFEISIYPSSM